MEEKESATKKCLSCGATWSRLTYHTLPLPASEPAPEPALFQQPDPPPAQTVTCCTACLRDYHASGKWPPPMRTQQQLRRGRNVNPT